MRQRNVRAWLVTWEGDHGRQNNVAVLLSATTAENRIAELIALHYASECGTLQERLAQLTERDWVERPYCARRERDGHFICGKNPYLYARRVEQVTVDAGENGAEVLHWREIDQ